jgi:hypothetical protein
MQLLPYCTLSLIDKDDFRQNTIGAVNNSENTVDELGDKIKVGIEVMTKKIKYSDKNLHAEYMKDKFKEDTKDY